MNKQQQFRAYTHRLHILEASIRILQVSMPTPQNVGLAIQYAEEREHLKVLILNLQISSVL